MEVVKYENISLKNNSEFNEQWVQELIAEDPSILGLGDLILRDKERIQPRAGRLDLLLQDADSNKRYEVEVQLGALDESHIIRTIEYWDIERKRYPQYDHTAVIIAEDITSRFLNVINLFNGMIPLIAIQMSALKLENNIGLVFTTVIDQMRLGLVDEDEETQEVTDRTYWENKSSKQLVSLADDLLEIAKEQNNDLELKYNKFYIGMAINSQPKNFFIVRPKKRFTRFDLKIKNTEETTDKLENAGLDVMDYDSTTGRYRIRLKAGEIKKHKEILTEIINEAFNVSN